MLRRIAVLIGMGILFGMVSLSCGGKFSLPTESTESRAIPSDKSYQMVATWTGMSDITDILLTQGQGTQLFLLFNHGGSGSTRGEVRSYARLKPTGTPEPNAGIDFLTLFNPVALSLGGDGAFKPDNRIYVLDAGDTCEARANPATSRCDTTGGWGLKISDLSKYWRVREYGLLGGDTISSFTDTSVAVVADTRLGVVHGIASDAQGRVYVAGLAIINILDPSDPRIRTRTFQWRIYRYLRGPRYPGVDPPDYNMPGANWHRDTSWVVEEGSGIGTVVDPRGLSFGLYGGGALYAADFAKNWTQKLSVESPSTGFYQLDGGQTGLPFNGPVDVAADRSGFLYVVDQGNRRVLRYGPDAEYVQRVDVEPDPAGRPLSNPVAVAADDSLVYVGDPGLGQVIRYQRRP